MGAALARSKNVSYIPPVERRIDLAQALSTAYKYSLRPIPIGTPIEEELGLGLDPEALRLMQVEDNGLFWVYDERVNRPSAKKPIPFFALSDSVWYHLQFLGEKQRAEAIQKGLIFDPAEIKNATLIESQVRRPTISPEPEIPDWLSQQLIRPMGAVNDVQAALYKFGASDDVDIADLLGHLRESYQPSVAVSKPVAASSSLRLVSEATVRPSPKPRAVSLATPTPAELIPASDPVVSNLLTQLGEGYRLAGSAPVALAPALPATELDEAELLARKLVEDAKADIVPSLVNIMEGVAAEGKPRIGYNQVVVARDLYLRLARLAMEQNNIDLPLIMEKCSFRDVGNGNLRWEDEVLDPVLDPDERQSLGRYAFKASAGVIYTLCKNIASGELKTKAMVLKAIRDLATQMTVEPIMVETKAVRAKHGETLLPAERALTEGPDLRGLITKLTGKFIEFHDFDDAQIQAEHTAQFARAIYNCVCKEIPSFTDKEPTRNEGRVAWEGALGGLPGTNYRISVPFEIVMQISQQQQAGQLTDERAIMTAIEKLAYSLKYEDLNVQFIR